MKPDWDLIIIGGGIQGAGIAWAAANRGYRTLLLEQRSWGWATSSRSSKLIHGGLRYLAQGELGLVRESLHEREWLLQQAPHLVQRLPLDIPIYRHSSYRPWQIITALTLYQRLAPVPSSAHYRKLPSHEWPIGLERQQLQGVFRYVDAQTDDQALTQAVVRQAERSGAHAWSESELIQAGATETGVQVLIQQDGTTQAVHGQALINAAGPWINRVVSRLTPFPPLLELQLVQGSHLLLEPQLAAQGFYLESPDDRRPVFVLPWQGKTLVGTTETVYHGDPSNVSPTPAELAYLQRVLQHYFPTYRANSCSAFAGLRVLPSSSHAGVHQRSREVQLVQGWNGRYLAVYGGKLTGFAATAERILSCLLARFHPTANAQTPNWREQPWY